MEDYQLRLSKLLDRVTELSEQLKTEKFIPGAKLLVVELEKNVERLHELTGSDDEHTRDSSS